MTWKVSCSPPNTAPTSGRASRLDKSASRRQRERSIDGDTARPVTGASATRAAITPHHYAGAHRVQRVVWPAPYAYFFQGGVGRKEGGGGACGGRKWQQEAQR